MCRQSPCCFLANSALSPAISRLLTHMICLVCCTLCTLNTGCVFFRACNVFRRVTLL